MNERGGALYFVAVPELGRRLVGPIPEMRCGQTRRVPQVLCRDLRHQQRVVGWSVLQGRVHLLLQLPQSLLVRHKQRRRADLTLVWT